MVTPIPTLSVGETVYYWNLGHRYHMALAKVLKVQTYGSPGAGKFEYLLQFPDGFDFWTLSDAIKKIDQNTVPYGYHLDGTAKQLGIERYFLETDEELRERINNRLRSMPSQEGFTLPKNAHQGHEVIENHAGGKTFKYCRQCKTEVI